MLAKKSISVKFEEGETRYKSNCVSLDRFRVKQILLYPLKLKA